MTTKTGGGVSLALIRRHCLHCSGDSFKTVLWCSVFECGLWRFRLGMKPATVRAKYGPGLVTPSVMPDANVSRDDLPNGIEVAASFLASRAKSVEEQRNPD